MERPSVMHLRPTDDRWAKIEAIGRLIRSTSYGDIIDYALEHTAAHYTQEDGDDRDDA